MNTRAIRTLLFGIPAILMLSGCLEENVRTTISADGSVVRTISMKLPARKLPEKAFPVPADSTWSVEWKEPSEKDNQFEYIATKSFQTPEELHREYAEPSRSNAFDISVLVNRRFQWFFTYFDYQETYTFHNPFADVPVSRYLTKDEIDRFQHGESSDTLKRKAERWYFRVIFEEIYGGVVAEAQRRGDPGLPASLLVERKEEYFERLWALDSANNAASKLGNGKAKNEFENAHDVLQVLAQLLGNNAVFELQHATEEAFATFERREDEIKHPDGWTNVVQMPGLLLETNSNTFEGNAVTWEFFPDQVRVGEYAMQASSRVVNIWAFIVTGVGLAGVVLLAALPAFFRKRS